MTVTAEGWIVLTVSPETVAWAQQIRRERDQRFRNVFPEAETDCRWVGEVGEAAFYEWLKQAAPGKGKWIRRRPVGQPDFIVCGQAIGVKSRKRKNPFRWTDGCGISTCHISEPVDHFFFTSYEVAKRRATLVGGISREEFRLHSREYKAGDRVHAGFTIREGGGILDLEPRFLRPPLEWLWVVTGIYAEPLAASL